MLFDFGFNLSPSADKIKKENLQKRLSKAESRLFKISKGKVFGSEHLAFIRSELELISDLKQKIEELQIN